MRAVVVDNEKDVRESLVQMLLSFCPEITEIKEADGVRSGLELIRKSPPDILYVDVEMGDGTGMDLLRQLNELSFPIVFITAYNKYAIDAFQFSAVDFLLKPIDPELLMLSVQKAAQKINVQQLSHQLKVLNDHILKSDNQPKKIVLKDSDRIYVVKTSEIVRCESGGAYTTFILQSAEQIVVSKNIKEFEELLEPFGFLRVHQSHLVNTACIKRFEKKDGGYLVLENLEEIPVAQRKREQVLQFLQNL